MGEVIDLDSLLERPPLEIKVKGRVLLVPEVSHTHFIAVRRRLDENDKLMAGEGTTQEQMGDADIATILFMYGGEEGGNADLTEEFLRRLPQRVLAFLVTQWMNVQRKVLSEMEVRDAGPPATAGATASNGRAPAGSRSTKP